MKKILLAITLLVFSVSSVLAVTNEERKAYDEFMLKLKACTPVSAKLFDGTHEVFGYEDGSCGYKVVYNNNKTYSCKFPKPVAEMFGYQSTKSLREGTTSSFVEEMFSSYYCQKQ